MSTLIDSGTLTLAAAGTSAEAAVPPQGAQRGEFHAVSVQNNLAEEATIAFVVTESLGGADVDCDLATQAVAAGAARAILVEGWLLTDSKIVARVAGGSTAGGDVHYAIRENA